MDLSVFVGCLEENIYILMQARNLCGYGLSSVTSGQGQGIYVQINQRLQTCITGLNQLVEDIRGQGPTPKQGPELADTTTVLRFLTPDERADLGQLDRAHDDLTSALSLVIRFRERLYSVGRQRQQAGDMRQD
jgi:hypothetical protein